MTEIPIGDTILETRDLTKYFPVRRTSLGSGSKHLKALEGVNLNIQKGETLGVVGESGSGKSTLGRVIVRLLDPTRGTVIFQGEEIMNLPDKKFRKYRRDIQIVFQDPYASLNPRMKIKEIIGEPLEIHGVKTKDKAEKVVELINLVGLDKNQLERYPHMFSGGQRQRIGVARALALNPKFLVLDEPVSALDVSIQSQIINLFIDLQEKLNLTYLFISHDLSVVRHISSKVAVIYLGKLMEVAPSEELFLNAMHPYTEALLSAIPKIDPDTGQSRIILSGDIPSPINVPKGCRFSTRCPKRISICSEVEPGLRIIKEAHAVACHRA